MSFLRNVAIFKYYMLQKSPLTSSTVYILGIEQQSSPFGKRSTHCCLKFTGGPRWNKVGAIVFPSCCTLFSPSESWQSLPCSICMYSPHSDSGLELIYSSGFIYSFVLWQYNLSKPYSYWNVLISTINIVAHVILNFWMGYFHFQRWGSTMKDWIHRGKIMQKPIQLCIVKITEKENMHACIHRFFFFVCWFFFFFSSRKYTL